MIYLPHFEHIVNLPSKSKTISFTYFLMPVNASQEESLKNVDFGPHNSPIYYILGMLRSHIYPLLPSLSSGTILEKFIKNNSKKLQKIWFWAQEGLINAVVDIIRIFLKITKQSHLPTLMPFVMYNFEKV